MKECRYYYELEPYLEDRRIGVGRLFVSDGGIRAASLASNANETNNASTDDATLARLDDTVNHLDDPIEGESDLSTSYKINKAKKDKGKGRVATTKAIKPSTSTSTASSSSSSSSSTAVLHQLHDTLNRTDDTNQKFDYFIDMKAKKTELRSAQIAMETLLKAGFDRSSPEVLTLVQTVLYLATNTSNTSNTSNTPRISPSNPLSPSSPNSISSTSSSLSSASFHSVTQETANLDN